MMKLRNFGSRLGGPKRTVLLKSMAYSSPKKRADYKRERFEELKRTFGGKCNHCGEMEKPLQFAHVRPTNISGRGRGKEARMFDIIKHRDCYVLLCVDCHSRMDARG